MDHISNQDNNLKHNFDKLISNDNILSNGNFHSYFEKDENAIIWDKVKTNYNLNLEQSILNNNNGGTGKLNCFSARNKQMDEKEKNIQAIGKERIIESERSMLKNIGNSFIITEKLLGHGSYGDVYLATDENGRHFAAKCCDMTDSGIPSILETAIMGSISHPFLNKALRIQASDKKLYIIQELAKTDLAKHTRRTSGNYQPSIDELKYWCYSLSQAVAVLHAEQIIHADIKASNVLLYDDGSVKLTDFTLATKKWSPTDKFTNTVCTCTHRPIECLLKRPWDESLDIWSLGCTFYEIAYGELLFPYQGAIEPEKNLSGKNKEFKQRLTMRSINAIIDWSTLGPIPTSFEVIGIPQYQIDYLGVKVCSDFNKPEMAIFNDLLYKMLTVDPSDRLTIKQVLVHPFFTGMKNVVYLSISRPLNQLPSNEKARVTRYIHRYVSQISNNKQNPNDKKLSKDNSKDKYFNIIEHLAMNIYSRCNNLHDISEQIKSLACTWIASKLVLGFPPKISPLPDQLLIVERSICHNLYFHFGLKL